MNRWNWRTIATVMANQTTERMLATPATALHRWRGGSSDHAFRPVTVKAMNAAARAIWVSYGNEGSLAIFTSIRSAVSHTTVMVTAMARFRRTNLSPARPPNGSAFSGQQQC